MLSFKFNLADSIQTAPRDSEFASDFFDFCSFGFVLCAGLLPWWSHDMSQREERADRSVLGLICIVASGLERQRPSSHAAFASGLDRDLDGFLCLESECRLSRDAGPTTAGATFSRCGVLVCWTRLVVDTRLLLLMRVDGGET